MSLGQRWMVEVIGRAVDHADSVHHAPRANVARHCERHDLGEPKRLKAECQHSPCSFGGVPAAPVLRGEAPTYFHARSEVGLEAGNGEANESGEGRDVPDLHRPQPEAVPVEVGLDARDKQVALSATMQPGDVLPPAGRRSTWRRALDPR